MGKSLITSKTFWLNLIGLASTVAGVLPPKYAAVVLPLANVGVRLLTDSAITGVFSAN
jgi:hypothetical protein